MEEKLGPQSSCRNEEGWNSIRLARRSTARKDECGKLKTIHGGAVAQLGARLDGIEEVVGSNPIGSTILPGSSPETWVTECTGYISNNLGPKGLSSGSSTRVQPLRRR